MANWREVLKCHSSVCLLWVSSMAAAG